MVWCRRAIGPNMTVLARTLAFLQGDQCGLGVDRRLGGTLRLALEELVVVRVQHRGGRADPVGDAGQRVALERARHVDALYFRLAVLHAPAGDD
jgi:hypothetical protein